MQQAEQENDLQDFKGEMEPVKVFESNAIMDNSVNASMATPSRLPKQPEYESQNQTNDQRKDDEDQEQVQM